MSEMKTVVLTTLEMEEPASSRTAWRFLQDWRVFSAMVPSTSSPSGVRGMEPEVKMAKGVLMAWDCIKRLV